MDDQLGIFITVWKLDDDYLPTSEKNQPNEENILVDKTTLDGLKADELRIIANKYGFFVTDVELEDLRSYNEYYED